MKSRKRSAACLICGIILGALCVSSCEHRHDFAVTDEQKPTCTERGSIEYECRRCGQIYADTVETTGHDYQITDGRAPICALTGYKDYQCTHCEDRYTETTAAVGHIYSPGDCAEPQTCARCGESVVWGHVGEGNFCDRCDACIFEPLRFSGSGSKLIEGVDLPTGDYEITVTYTGEYTLALYLDDHLLANDYGETTFICQIHPSRTDSILDDFGTPIAGGVLSVQTSGGEWTVTVSAVRG